RFVGHGGACFDGDFAAFFAFAGEHRGQRGGRRARCDRQHLRAAGALGTQVVCVARVFGLPEVGAGGQCLGGGVGHFARGHGHFAGFGGGAFAFFACVGLVGDGVRSCPTRRSSDLRFVGHGGACFDGDFAAF